MLPKPFEEWMPSSFRDGDDPSRDAFCSHMDQLMDVAKSETLGVGLIPDPVRASQKLLRGLGEMLEAGIADGDSSTACRRKIGSAVRSHKSRSTWDPGVKPIIDSTVGGDSKLVSFIGGDDFILCGSGSEPDSYLWAALGGEDPDAGYGIRMVGVGVTYGTDLGSFVEPIKGTVLIDVDSSTLTHDEVEAVKAAIADSVASYLVVYLGYMVGDRFVPYENGLA